MKQINNFDNSRRPLLTLETDKATAETLPAIVGTNVEWAGFTWKEVKFVAT